jgi:hypothetical protein
VSQRLALAGPPESALLVEGDGRVVRGRHPEAQARGWTLPGPADHRAHERGADPAPACFRADEHSDELWPRIVGYVGVAGETGRDSQPPAILLRDEDYAVGSRGPMRSALAPEIAGERLFSRQGRAECHGRIRQGA